MAKKKRQPTAARSGRSTTSDADDLVGKRIQIDRATWDAIALMAREQMKDLPEITEEAFRDLLKKYGRTADFREALKMSAQMARKRR
ncbi:MAG: hypothetical protein JSR61_13830 [Proteobacteria bacterium]|nr:hypothetical protein [Pseudomonadota bacterium]